jgi:hypothetical protein
MADQFTFHGQTTFIDKPKDTVIQDFQNTYVSGETGPSAEALTELKRLVELLLSSQDLPKENKEEAVQAVHSVAEQIKENKGGKLTLKGTLDAVRGVVEKAADIAGPAVAIISTVLKLIG